MEASGKKKNEHNRKKSITIGFRATPQERDELYKRIHLSGRTIQEYMLQSALCQQVVVVGNSRLQHEIQERLKEIEPKLDLIARGEHVEEAVMEELRTIYEIAQTWE